MKGKHIITLYPENIKIYAKINPSLLYMRYLCENKRFYFIYSQKKHLYYLLNSLLDSTKDAILICINSPSK